MVAVKMQVKVRSRYKIKTDSPKKETYAPAFDYKVGTIKRCDQVIVEIIIPRLALCKIGEKYATTWIHVGDVSSDTLSL